MRINAKYIRERIACFGADESGQSMLIMAMTFFILIVMVGMIIGVGDVTTDQMRIQNAADSAAYAGAAVEADCLAQIAWVNEGMAVIYGRAITNSVKNITTRTHESLGSAWWNPATATSTNGNLDLKAAQVYVPEESSDNSWAQSGEAWYSHLGKIQRLIAIAAPMLIKNQIYHSAHANYFQEPESGDVNKPLRIAVFPNPANSGNPAWEFYPEDGSFHDAVLEHNSQDLSEGSKGWKITSETDPGYAMEMMHLIVDKSVADNGVHNQWHIILDEPDTSNDSGETVSNTLDVMVDSTRYSPNKSVSSVQGAAYHKGQMYQTDSIDFIINGESSHIETYAKTQGGEIVLVIKEPGNSNKNGKDIIEKTEDGTMLNGKEYGEDGDGNYVSGGNTYNGEIDINGMKVPASFPGFVDGIRITWPLEIYLDGKVHAWFTKDIKIHYHFNNYIGWIRANDTEAWVRSLLTTSPDRNWRSIPGSQGRREHRLFEYPEDGLTNDGRFKYEIANSGSWLRDMSFIKLGLRGLMHEKLISKDTLEGYVPLTTLPKEYSPRDTTAPILQTWKSDTQRWMDYESSVWDILKDKDLLWACPPRVPPDDATASRAGAFGGFFDLNAGQLANCDRDGDGQADAGTSAYCYSATAPSSYKPGTNVSGDVYLKRYIYSGNLLMLNLSASEESLKTMLRFHPYNLNPLWYYYRGFVKNPPPYKGDGSKEDPYYTDDELKISSDYKEKCGFFVVERYEYTALFTPGSATFNDLAYRIQALGNASRLHAENMGDNLRFYPDIGLGSANFGAWGSNFFAYLHEGYVYLCMYDPYGALQMFKHQPRFPFVQDGISVANVGDVYAKDNSPEGLTWDDVKNIIKNTPAYVRRYAYHGGKYGVGSSTSNAGFLENGVSMGTSLSTLSFGRLNANPLEATSQIFRKPLAVCVYMPERLGWLAPFLGKDRDKVSDAQRRIGQGNPLYLTEEGNKKKWNSGHFAFSAARIFMRSPDGNGFMTNFAYYDDDLEPSDFEDGPNKLNGAALGFPDGINQMTNYVMRGYRQLWLNSTDNFFEPVWTAALVPFNQSLDIRDVEPYEKLASEINTPTDYLINKYTEAASYHYWSRRDGWIKNAYDKDSALSYESTKANKAWDNITAPPLQKSRQGQRVDWRNRSFGPIMRH